MWFTRLVAEPFLPFHTSRLTVRTFRPDDAEPLTAYRNDPEVARYQDWELPVTLERTQARIAEDGNVTGDPSPGQAWQLAVEVDGQLAGDIYLRLGEEAATAMIGYTFSTAFQGRGLASEAVGALVDRLFDRFGDLHRVEATLDPQNLASIRLLEGLGFSDEGTTRRSVMIRGQWVDDGHYSLLRDDHDAWRARPAEPPREVRLVEITDANLRTVLDLRTFGWQERLVSPNVRSLAQAHVPGVDDDGGPLRPWVRAIEADGELVGFVMMAGPSPTIGDPYLWRFMIDRAHQRRGIGRMALARVIEQALAWDATAIEVSWVPGFGSPAPFYLRAGFVDSGRLDASGEVLGRLTLASVSPVPPSP